MRDFTNLGWPEAPFGADQRPFGRRSDMLAAFAFEWANRRADDTLPVGAAVIYLCVRKRGSAEDIRAGTVSIGFRATVVDCMSEAPALLALVDRALTRARRHAAIVAGHRLDDDLTRMTALSTTPLRGAAGVLAAWADRTKRERGLALMVDTYVEASATGADLDATGQPRPTPMQDSAERRVAVACTVLERCLAIGLTAAVYTGRYRWDGTFPVGETIDCVAWDVLTPTERAWDLAEQLPRAGP